MVTSDGGITIGYRLEPANEAYRVTLISIENCKIAELASIKEAVTKRIAEQVHAGKFGCVMYFDKDSNLNEVYHQLQKLGYTTQIERPKSGHQQVLHISWATGDIKTK